MVVDEWFNMGRFLSLSDLEKRLKWANEICEDCVFRGRLHCHGCDIYYDKRRLEARIHKFESEVNPFERE